MRVAPTGSFWRSAVIVIAWTVCLRVITFFISFIYSNQTIEDYLDRSDAPSYIALARMIHSGERSPAPWDERVYWGWALALVPFGPNGPTLEFGCIGLGFALAGLAAFLFFLLTRDFLLSVLFGGLGPTWVFQSSLGMTEPAYLAFLLASACLFTSGRVAGTGACLAGAALVRPTAVFAWLGFAVVLARRGAWRQLAVLSVLALLGPITTIALNVTYYGDWNRQSALHGQPQNIAPDVLKVLAPDGVTRTYGYLPFKALIETPRLIPTPPWKIVFIYTHVVAVLLATLVAVYQVRGGDDLDLVVAVWAAGNTIFILSTGPYWGFHSFDRYCVWALPAYLYACREVIPRRFALPWLIGLVSLALGLWALTRR